MPQNPDTRRSVDTGEHNLNPRSGPHGADRSDQANPMLTIGLVNNMQDGALDATERQFMSLLQRASEGMAVRLRIYQLSGIPRGESAARHIADDYSDFDTLRNAPPDGLIVTGREPATARLQDEPYWQSFVQLLEWARDHTLSTIWSCLAAHAAVLHMDGIGRVRSSSKFCGLYDCEALSNHPMMEGTPSRFLMPHSRWNGLEETALREHGYQVLTGAAGAGVDAFVRQERSLFLFFQGHPEYEANTLLLEYRRDVARYLRGESTGYPSIPHAYFDGSTVAALEGIEREARLFPREELLEMLNAVLRGTIVHHSWQQPACSIYRNWLQYLAARKDSACHAPATVSERAAAVEPGRMMVGSDPGKARSAIARL